MCLTRVIGRKVLQEELPCFGVVELTNEGDKSVYQSETIVADSNGIMTAKTEVTITATCHSISPADRKYKAGFHRFLELESAEKRKQVGQAIRNYIIPKGTEVIIGVEREGYVVVTPILSLKITKAERSTENGTHQYMDKRFNTKELV